MADDFYNLIAYTDGGTRSNPGPGACAVWFPQLVRVVGCFLPYVTNNEAEYEGLILALMTAKRRGNRRLKVYTDSQLMQRQITGKYRVKNEKLIPLYETAIGMIGKLDSFEIFHVPRAANKEADAECNRIQDLGQ